jgi:hypothetical protein
MQNIVGSDQSGLVITEIDENSAAPDQPAPPHCRCSDHPVEGNGRGRSLPERQPRLLHPFSVHFDEAERVVSQLAVFKFGDLADLSSDGL